MDGIAVTDSSIWRIPVSELPGYREGNALGWLYSLNKQASVSYLLTGRLYLAKSGWLLLSVPNALVRGVFDALYAPGAQLPTCGSLNVPNEKPELLNAHISVMTAAEVEQIGADKITERGHMFGYSLGTLKEVDIKNIAGVTKAWVLSVTSPQINALRKSYGLTTFPNDKPLHITVGVRKRRAATENNNVFESPSSRGELKTATDDKLDGGAADNVPDSSFPESKLQEGAEHEREHTDNDQIAKEIAKDHLHEDPEYYEEKTHKEAAEIVKAAYRHARGYRPPTPPSVYLRQLANSWRYRGHPVRYDSSKTVYQNIQNQMAVAKERGDFIRRSKRNHDMYLSSIDPAYRHRLALDTLNGRLVSNPLDDAIERYGDGLLAYTR